MSGAVMLPEYTPSAERRQHPRSARFQYCEMRGLMDLPPPADMINFVRTNCLYRLNGVYYLSEPAGLNRQEPLYHQVRTREGRIYSDRELKHLPCIDAAHAYFKEWKMRAESLRKMRNYVMRKRKPLTILDVGCGNGWMANHLACISGCAVLALDVNRAELEQAARVFSTNPHIIFVYGDLFMEILPCQSIEMIILAGSVQYFTNMRALVKRLFDLIHQKGEVHLVDSPLYSAQSIGRAKARTRIYYRELGYPEMAAYYHQHVLSDLETFHWDYLYNPDTVFQRIRRALTQTARSPFPWIKLIKDIGSQTGARSDPDPALH